MRSHPLNPLSSPYPKKKNIVRNLTKLVDFSRFSPNYLLSSRQLLKLATYHGLETWWLISYLLSLEVNYIIEPYSPEVEIIILNNKNYQNTPSW